MNTAKYWAVLIACCALTGCPVLIRGLVKNETTQRVFHVTDWKPFEEPIPQGEARRIDLFSPGACIELLIDGESRYFEVPVPPPASQLDGYWHVTYPVVLNSSGLFYDAAQGPPVQFDEITACAG